MQSGVGKLSCNKTALKRCTSTETFWNRKAPSLSFVPVPVIIIVIIIMNLTELNRSPVCDLHELQPINFVTLTRMTNKASCNWVSVLQVSSDQFHSSGVNPSFRVTSLMRPTPLRHCIEKGLKVVAKCHGGGWG